MATCGFVFWLNQTVSKTVSTRGGFMVTCHDLFEGRCQGLAIKRFGEKLRGTVSQGGRFDAFVGYAAHHENRGARRELAELG